MKKLFCILCVVLFICCLTSCSSNGKINDISNTLGVDISDGTIISNIDTHGGFHGDGYIFVEMNFDDTAGENMAAHIAGINGWRSLPLSENLQTVVYGKDDGDVHYGPFIDDNTIPAVEHGYYYFYDRHSDSNNPKDDTDILKRYSFNFTIAIYDTDNNNLYYYELDT